MTKNQWLFLVVICFATHIIRSTYGILKHKKLLIPGKLSFAVIFTNMLVLWISWVLLCRYDYHRIELPLILNITGGILSVLGVIMFLTALFTIKTLESYEGDLITTGIYAKIRHPMYLGFIFWLAGFPMLFGAIFSYIFSIIFFCNIMFWRHLEETELIERFPGYVDYRRKTIF
jgi:protein-S-isoprenylcysteine O-methyltransferase Ste14